MQTEFEFVNVFRPIKSASEAFCDFIFPIIRGTMTDGIPCLSEIFEDMDWAKLHDDNYRNYPSFPMTIGLGDPNQPEFEFVCVIDQANWDFPVEYHWKIPLDDMRNTV